MVGTRESQDCDRKGAQWEGCDLQETPGPPEPPFHGHVHSASETSSLSSYLDLNGSNRQRLFHSCSSPLNPITSPGDSLPSLGAPVSFSQRTVQVRICRIQSIAYHIPYESPAESTRKMAVLFSRQGGHSFSSIHHKTQGGWNYCMTKAYCKVSRSTRGSTSPRPDHSFIVAGHRRHRSSDCGALPGCFLLPQVLLRLFRGTTQEQEKPAVFHSCPVSRLPACER